MSPCLVVSSPRNRHRAPSVEAELACHGDVLRGHDFVERALQRVDEVILAARIEPLDDLALLADEAVEQARQVAVSVADLLAHHHRQVPIGARQAIDAIHEEPVLRVEVARQRAGDPLLEIGPPGVQLAAQLGHQAVALAPHRVAVDRAARGFQRHHANLQRRQQELGALGSFCVLIEGNQDLGIGDAEGHDRRSNGSWCVGEIESQSELLSGSLEYRNLLANLLTAPHEPAPHTFT